MDRIIRVVKKLFSSRLKTVGVIIAILIIGFLGIQKFKGTNTQPQYQTTRVERGTIVSSVTASGRSLTSNTMSIMTGASGVLKKVYVRDGEQVVYGQKIADITLDQQGQQRNSSAWSSYLSAKNSVDSASANQYSLQSDMFSKWKTFLDLADSVTYDTPEERSLPQFHIAQNDWLAAEAKYKNQQSVLDQARASMNSSWLSYQTTSPIITAPIAGVVGSVGIVDGMVLGSQGGTTASDQTTTPTRVAVIQNETNPILTFNLSEIDIQNVSVGQKATITLDSVPGKTFAGRVVTVDRIGSVSNNVTSYPVIITLDTKVPEIMPNMASTANIIIQTKNDVLLVPSGAIQTQGEQSVIRVLQNGKEQILPVQTGISSDSQTEVVSGLSEGEVVITGNTSTSSTQRTGGSIFGGGGGFGAFRR